ncbi:MAG: response regulator [bacterium]
MTSPYHSFRQPGKPGNTLRIQEAELASLSNELDSESSGDIKRRTVRWKFLRNCVRIDMRQPGGVTTNLHYAVRNLSPDGLGILHSSYVHPGTLCTIYLTSPSGEEKTIEGSVMRCQHVRGRVHEIGVKFKAPVNVRDFVEVNPLEGRFTLEYVHPLHLSGTVMHVGDSALDRRLVRHFLGETSLNVTSIDNAHEALARCAEGFDALLIDNDLPDMPGTELVDKIRNTGTQVPIILIAADTHVSTTRAATNARASAVVSKPLTSEKILQAIAEFLLLDASGNGGSALLYSSLKKDNPARAHLAKFINDLRLLAVQISKAISTENTADLRRLCIQIRGSAPSLGFKPIGDSANTAIVALDATGSINESIRPLRQLIAMCLHASIRADEKTVA